MIKEYKAVFFDLDGTILNTLPDIADAVNYTLRHFGYPQRTLDEIRQFTGNGQRTLCSKSLPFDDQSKLNIVFKLIFSFSQNEG